MADENAILLTTKDQVGSTRNFRDYKINESSFPHQTLAEYPSKSPDCTQASEWEK